jgi:hypothetical protein
MENTWDPDEDISNDETLPVSSTDELTTDGGSIADRTRKLGEFSRVNSPLSSLETKKRKSHGWVGRHPENIQDLIPLREKPDPKPK